ncbi:hypothetical protein U9M48_043062 [Paspalum notatum var. saurae]|uniref:Uncharacterized protein n=1 Tax=Paspalum notatum var. saurae TaxID=547442 RepID=A0AAQ3XF81_PASNO
MDLVHLPRHRLLPLPVTPTQRSPPAHAAPSPAEARARTWTASQPGPPITLGLKPKQRASSTRCPALSLRAGAPTRHCRAQSLSFRGRLCRSPSLQTTAIAPVSISHVQRPSPRRPSASPSPHRVLARHEKPPWPRALSSQHPPPHAASSPAEERLGFASPSSIFPPKPRPPPVSLAPFSACALTPAAIAAAPRRGRPPSRHPLASPTQPPDSSLHRAALTPNGSSYHALPRRIESAPPRTSRRGPRVHRHRTASPTDLGGNKPRGRADLQSPVRLQVSGHARRRKRRDVDRRCAFVPWAEDPACKELSTQEKPVIKEPDDRLYPEQEDEGSLIKSVPASRGSGNIWIAVLEVVVPVGSALFALFISS